MLHPIRKELVDDVHDASEHRGPNGLAFGFVRRALPHLVERFRWLADVEPTDRPRRRVRPGGHLGHAHHGIHAERVAEVREESFGVGIKKDRRFTRRADAGRLHLGLVDGARVESEIVEDLVREGKLDRPGQFESVTPGQLRRRRHAADEMVLLEAQDPHTAARHDRRRGQAVVSRTNDDRVVIRHLLHRSRGDTLVPGVGGEKAA